MKADPSRYLEFRRDIHRHPELSNQEVETTRRIREFLARDGLELCPIGALFAAIMFYWFSGKDWVLEQVNKGRAKPLGAWYYPMGKYVFVIATAAVLVLGSVLGGIG